MKIYNFNKLDECDLIVDAIYEGGNNGNVGDDPINKILPVGNLGGFRYAGSLDDLKYIVLYSSGENINWPDRIDLENGIFQYYGDNREPGNNLHKTKKKGNEILKKLFESLHAEISPRVNIPPIFIFQKYSTENSKRSVQFKGLCVPGAPNKKIHEDLIAIWKTSNGLRFQNYKAFFTILDVACIERQMINKLNLGICSKYHLSSVYENWIKTGLYRPLRSERTISVRSINEQLPSTEHELSLLKRIYEYFILDPTLFEFMAADIYRMTNSNIIIDEVTKRTQDGGRDAIGRIKFGLDEDPIYTEFAIEAKCYNPGINGKNPNKVGVKDVSRLISRIRNRQLGILVTTSVVADQAYKEVRKDGHPIIFICAKDVVKILLDNGINTLAVLDEYLNSNYKR